MYASSKLIFSFKSTKLMHFNIYEMVTTVCLVTYQIRFLQVSKLHAHIQYVDIYNSIVVIVENALPSFNIVWKIACYMV